MMDLIDKVRRLCAEQRDDLAQYLAVGGAPDYNAYCKAVGAVQALDTVLATIEDAINMFVEDTDHIS